MAKNKNIHSQIAQYAYQCVKNVVLAAQILQNQECDKFNNVNEQDIKNSTLSEYKSYVRKVPMYIKNNGLAATFAFILSKNDKTAWNIIYCQTQEWLQQKGIIQNNDLMESILLLPSDKYRFATAEVLNLFNWLSRFAEGLIEDDTNEE